MFTGIRKYVLRTNKGLYILEKFHPHKFEILQWLNSFEYVVDVAKINGETKVHFLLYMLENSILMSIKEKSAPTNPFNLSYDVLVSHLQNLYAFLHGEHAANYRFFIRDQLPQEPVQDYVLALRKLSSKCSSVYKTNDYLKTRFIDGLFDKETKTLLENDESMSFAIAVAIAKQRELAKNKQNGVSYSK
ncbi:hypothetical protein M0804_013280 [Polistes exclamans]|nr:hypothetical protein M0804_013280 [Polistes exclamans]